MARLVTILGLKMLCKSDSFCYKPEPGSKATLDVMDLCWVRSPSAKARHAGLMADESRQDRGKIVKEEAKQTDICSV